MGGREKKKEGDQKRTVMEDTGGKVEGKRGGENRN